MRVLAAVIRRNGAYLLGRRPAHKRHGGLFEFPGGKVGPGETDRDAVARELDEELGLEVDHVGPVLFAATDPGSSFHVHFVPVRASGHPVAREHEELRWLTPAELLADRVRLAPSDRRFVQEALESGDAGGKGAEDA